MYIEPVLLFNSIMSEGNYEFNSDLELYTIEIAKANLQSSSQQILESLQSLNSSFFLEESDDIYKFEFEDGAGNWTENYQSYLFKDLSIFWKYCNKVGSVPKQFYICDSSLSEKDIDDEDDLKRILATVKWTAFLSDIADHVQDDGILVFFVNNKDGKSKTCTITPSVQYSDIKSIKVDTDLTKYEHMYKSWHFKDIHQKERQSCILVSFAEIISSSESDDLYLNYLLTTRKFHDRFCENHDIYVNRFTVDSQLQEIDEQYFSFVNTLQDIVTASQNKAFALPGVMVAIAALSRTQSYLGVIAIIVGVTMTRLLIKHSNEMVLENLDQFKKTIERALGQYVKSRNDITEVTEHASGTKTKLLTSINKAKGRIGFINKMANWMVGTAIAMVIFIAYSIATPTVDNVVKGNADDKETATNIVDEEPFTEKATFGEIVKVKIPAEKAVHGKTSEKEVSESAVASK